MKLTGVCQKGRRTWKSDQQKSHIVQGFPFLALVFLMGITHFYQITLAMNFDFSKISKKNLKNSQSIYKERHFLNLPSCFFFWNRPLIDTLPTALVQNFFLNLPKKVCYRLHPKYTSFSCFPIICFSAQSESLYFKEIRVTYAIFDILKEAD